MAANLGLAIKHDADRVKSCLSVITATFTGPRRTTLFPKAARPAAPCATYCYHATDVERQVRITRAIVREFVLVSARVEGESSRFWTSVSSAPNCAEKHSGILVLIIVSRRGH